MIDPTGLLTNAVSSLLELSVSALDKNQKVAKVLKKAKILPLRDDFESIYLHTLIDYGVDKQSRELVKLFGFK